MAIVTHKFRVSAASGFATTFTTDNIYLVLGRPQSWADTSYSTTFASQASGTVTDLNPPNPVDNWVNEYAFWRDAMAGVKLTYSNVSLATTRNNWSNASTYDMYRHDVSNASPTATSKYDLSDSNFIVYVTSTGCVYKVLWNGRNGTTSATASTKMPTATSGIEDNSAIDGYKWKFMYQLTSADADFITENYIPVKTTTSIVSINGIDTIYLSSNGTGYTGTPVVNIYGDGVGAAATAVVSGTSVVRINMTSSGSQYTWARVDLVGGGATTTGVAIAIIAPSGGHGSRPIEECMAHNVMISGTVTGYEQSDFPVNQDFRSVGLIKNPLAYNSSVGFFVTSNVGTIFSSNSGRILRTLTMVSTTTATPTNDIVLTDGNASGIFVFQSSGTVQVQYIQPVNSDVPANILTSRIDTATTKQLYQFTTSTPGITGTSYSASLNTSTGITGQLPEIQPYSGSLIYVDYRQPVTRAVNQNEKVNIVINF